MIKIGVIGCGYWGLNIVRNFQGLRNCQVKAVADLVPENLAKIKKLYPHIKTTRDYEAILKDPQIEAVAVVTQAVTHYSLIKESLLAGKHVFTEKPITTKASQGEELVALAKKKKKVLMVGHTFEYNSAVRKIKEILKKGGLGKPLFIYSRRLSPGPVRSDVSVLWDFAFHDISILTYILKKNPLRVSARGKSFLKKGIEDFGFIEMDFPGNITAQIQVSWLYPKKERGVVIVGSKKMLVYDETDPEKPLVVFSRNNFSWQVKPEASPKVKKAEPLRIECRHFIDCVVKNKTPLTDGKRGVEIVKILEVVQKSLKLNGRPMQYNVSK